MMARSCSKRPPTSLPLPAMVSSSTVVVMPGKSTSLSSAAIFSMPASMPCPTWLPGWKVIELAGRVLHALQVVGKGHARKLRHVRLGRAGVERVRRVRDQPVDARAGAFGVEGRDIRLLNGLWRCRRGDCA